MAPRGGSGQDRRQDFLKAVEKQKLDTVRWSLQYGGQNPGTRDDEGNTAIMIAASQNLRKALLVLLEMVRKTREVEILNLTDGQGEGRTAMMMAAAAGHFDVVQELKDAGANWTLKCAEGLTAGDYARQAGHDVIAAYFDRGCVSEDEDDGGEGEDDGGGPIIEGESASQRRKRIKREKEAAATKGRSDLAAPPKEQQAAAKLEEQEEAADEGPVPEPVWEEVGRALSDAHVVQLTIDKKNLTAPVVVDPALWRCRHINSLTLRLGPALTTLTPASGPGIGALKALKTLIVSRNGLVSLPDELCGLPLKVLEADNNAIARLPDKFGRLDALETLNLSNNCLTSIEALAGCKTLVTLNLDANQLTSLEGAKFESMPRLITLSARSNKIEEIPDEIGNCAALAELQLSNNKIEVLPSALGNLKEKKVRVIELSNNPLCDPKVRKMLDKSSTFVKELLPYLRKGGGGGGKGKKGKKAKKASSDEEEEEEEEEQEKAAAPSAPAPAAAPASAPEAASSGAGEGATASDAAAPAPAPAATAAAAAPPMTQPKAKPLSKKEMLKEKERAERKVAEEAMKARTAAAAEKEREKEAKRLQQLKELEEAAAAGGGADDSDDEWNIPKRAPGAAAAGGGGGFLYSMTPEQLKEAEAREAARLAEERRRKEEEEQRTRAQQDEQEAADSERKMAALELKAKKGSADQYTWEFSSGQFVRKQLDAGQQPLRLSSTPSNLPSNAYSISAELSVMMVGRIIGKGGENIRATEAKSGANVKILQVTGTHASIESARALINKNLQASRPAGR